MAPTGRPSQRHSHSAARAHHVSHLSNNHRPTVPSPLNSNAQQARTKSRNQASKPAKAGEAAAEPENAASLADSAPASPSTSGPTASNKDSSAPVASDSSPSQPNILSGVYSPAVDPATAEAVQPAPNQTSNPISSSASQLLSRSTDQSHLNNRRSADDLHEDEMGRGTLEPVDSNVEARFADNTLGLRPSETSTFPLPPKPSDSGDVTEVGSSGSAVGLFESSSALQAKPPTTPNGQGGQANQPLRGFTAGAATWVSAGLGGSQAAPSSGTAAFPATTAIGPEDYRPTSTISHMPSYLPSHLPKHNLLGLIPTNENPQSRDQAIRAQFYVTPDEEKILNDIVSFAYAKPEAWLSLVGLYFLGRQADPNIVLRDWKTTRNMFWDFTSDFHAQDLRDRAPESPDNRWRRAGADLMVVVAAEQIFHNEALKRLLEKVIVDWAFSANSDIVIEVLRRADWVHELSGTAPWYEVDTILKMSDGPARDAAIRAGRSQSPRVWGQCLNAARQRLFLGIRTSVDQQGNTIRHHLKRGSTDYEEPFAKDPSPSPSRKRLRMDLGRPIQIHGVPPEERALDSSGRSLPWGLEYHESHALAQGQRRAPEERGPFGKPTKRRATSRTRTATPAKKENPAVDAFSKALQYDAERQAQSSANTPNTRVSINTKPSTMLAEAQPTQVIIYGYSSESQWAALNDYEKISAGMICEDYSRDPPNEKRYGGVYRLPGPKRPLTQLERTMKARYAGGEHWVKVTFDSKQAAEKAMEASPRQLYGHWVHARPYYDHGPEKDEPLPIQADEHGSPVPKYGMNSPSHSTQPSQHADSLDSILNSTPQIQNGSNSPDTASTVTSATATGVESPELRQRQVQQQAAKTLDPTSNPAVMRRFPDQARYVLRPASEAFAPQPSWWERQFQALRNAGLWPQNMFDNAIIKRDDGTLDFSNASIYWRILYTIDSILRTDLCQLHAMD